MLHCSLDKQSVNRWTKCQCLETSMNKLIHEHHEEIGRPLSPVDYFWGDTFRLAYCKTSCWGWHLTAVMGNTWCNRRLYDVKNLCQSNCTKSLGDQHARKVASSKIINLYNAASACNINSRVLAVHWCWGAQIKSVSRQEQNGGILGLLRYTAQGGCMPLHLSSKGMTTAL